MRDAAGVQHRPLLGHVLPGRQARRVEARSRTFFSALDRNTPPTLARGSSRTQGVRPARAYVCVRGTDAADLLQRIVSNDVLAAGTLRGAAPDAEGPRDRAARRLARGGRRLPAADRAGARRGRPRPPRAACASPRAARSSSRSTPRRSSSARPRGSRHATTACRRSRCSMAPSRRTADDELERLRILARTPRWGREIDEGILPAEAGLDERAVSFTKGCYPGQEPLARLRLPRPRQPHAPRARASTARRRSPGRRGSLRGASGRARDERRPGSRARLRSGPRCPRTRALEVAGRPARIH